MLLKLAEGPPVLAQDYIRDAYTQETVEMPFGGSVHEDAGAAVLDYPDKLVTPCHDGRGCAALGRELGDRVRGHGGHAAGGPAAALVPALSAPTATRLSGRLAWLGGSGRFRQGQLVCGRRSA